MVQARRYAKKSESSDRGTLPQRAQLRLHTRHRWMVVAYSIATALVELAAMATYAYIDQNVVSWTAFGEATQRHIATNATGPAPDEGDFGVRYDFWEGIVTHDVAFGLQSACSVLLLASWLLSVGTNNVSTASLLTLGSVVNVLTAVPGVVCLVAEAFGAPWSRMWLPMFLRVWSFYDAVIFTLHFTDTGTQGLRELTDMVLNLLAAMITCVGAFHAVENFASETSIRLFESLYFTIVTFGTIGYGEIGPTSWQSQLVTVVIIAVAVYRFPTFFSAVADIARGWSGHYDSRRGLNPHVVVAGHLSSQDIVFFLNEFCGGVRRFTSLNIVILSSLEYDPEIRMLAQTQGLANRVFLLLGDPRSRDDLDRCDAAYARCIFLPSSMSLLASDADADVILRSTAVYQYDRHLPLNVVLRRERNTPLVAATGAANILEKERLKFSLLGMGVVSPGALPLIVNLVRSYDSAVSAEAAASEGWKGQTEWSMGNELYSFEPPECLHGRTFHYIAAQYRRECVTLIGVVEQDGGVVLNPRHFVCDPGRQLLAIAADDKVIDEMSRRLEEEANQPRSDADLHDVFLDTAPDSQAVHRNVAARGAAAHRGAGPQSAAGVQAVLPVDLRDPSVQPLLDSLSGHVLLVDLHSAHRSAGQSQQAEVDQEVFRATDLFNVTRAIKMQDASVPIVLLSRGALHRTFAEMWRDAGYEPVYHVGGCGLDAAALRQCHPERSKGTLVFSTADGLDEDGDTMAMLVVASIEELCREAAAMAATVAAKEASAAFVHATMASRDVHDPTAKALVPAAVAAESAAVGEKAAQVAQAAARAQAPAIVSELRRMESLTLLPPYYAEDRMAAMAAQNFAFEPAFVTGRVICAAMLDSALYQVYFNPQVLRTVDALIFGPGGTPAVSSMPVPEGCRTYHDVEAQCMRLGFVPIALYRLIADDVNTALQGHRFMFINPHSGTPVVASDHVYFLV